MSRTGKNDPRLKAYADVDEANCTIGLALSLTTFDEPVRALLVAVQNDLFDVGADLCTPVVENPEHEPLRVTEAYVERLEAACDEYNDKLEPLRSFVLPGGTVGASQLHVARTVVRRAERSTWAALDTYHGGRGDSRGGVRGASRRDPHPGRRGRQGDHGPLIHPAPPREW